MGRFAAAVLLGIALSAGILVLGRSSEDARPETVSAAPEARPPAAANRIVELLDRGVVVFGSMVQDRTEAGGKALAADPRVDYAFYDMERNYDLEELRAFLAGFRDGGSKAVLVRIAPVGEDREAARERVSQLLDEGVDGIIFPHVRNRAEAEYAIGLLRAGERALWPLEPDGIVLGHFMIEDRDAVENAREIMETPGIGLVSPGAGSLRSAYDGDEDAVEAAVQRIAAGCEESGVVCAKLVSVDDVEQRLREGFRVIIASGEALDRGLALAGREP